MKTVAFSCQESRKLLQGLDQLAAKELAAWAVLNSQGRNKRWHWVLDAKTHQLEGVNYIFKTTHLGVRCGVGSTQKQRTACSLGLACPGPYSG